MPCFRRETLQRWYRVALFIFCAAVCLFLPPLAHTENNRPFLTDTDQFNYAKLLYEQGHYRVAAREFGKVIRDYPASPLKGVAHFRMASAYRKAGLDREALSQFRQFLKNFPDSALSAAVRVTLNQSRRGSTIPLSLSPPPLPIERLTGDEPLRAVQVSVFNGRSLREVEREFDALKASGVNTVILRVFHNRGDRFYTFIAPRGDEGVYFKTSHAPVVADILGRIIKIAHARGLRIFAWMTTRYAGYGLDGRNDLGCKGYDISSGNLVRCRGMDLFNDEVLHHLEGLYADLARYDLDGILFQDDLVLRHTEGFGMYAEAYYRREAGLELVPSEMYRVDGEGDVYYTPKFWTWASWKNRRILEVARRLMRVVKRERPETEFAINLMYETLSNPRYALAWLSQDISAATREGFDYYAVMAYHRQMESELGEDRIRIKALIEDMTSDAVQIVGDPRKVLIKLQSIDWETSYPIADGEIYDLLERVGRVKGVSLALFPYRTDIPLRNF